MPSKSASILGHSCGFIPLHVVVLLYSLSLLALSAVSFTLSLVHEVNGPWVLLVGGLSPSTNCVVIIIGALGIMFSVASVAGVKDGNSTMVRAFARFALLRVFVLAFVRWLDLDTLATCDDTSIGTGTSLLVGAFEACKLLWNQYLYVAFADSFVSCYGAYSASRWCRMNDQQTAPLLPKESTPLQCHDAFSKIGRPAEASQKLPHSYRGPPTGIL